MALNAPAIARIWLIALVVTAFCLPDPPSDLGSAFQVNSHELPTADVLGRPLVLLVPRALAFSLTRMVAALCLSAILIGLGVAAWTLASRRMGSGAGAEAPLAWEWGSATLDVLNAIPRLFWAFLVLILGGSQTFSSTVLLALISTPFTLRVVMQRWHDPVAFQPALRAATQLGATRWDLLKRHVLPAYLHDILMLAPTWIAHGMLLETTLTYLGIGIEPRDDTMGFLLLQVRNYWMEVPTLSWIVGLPFACTILALQSFYKRPYADTR